MATRLPGTYPTTIVRPVVPMADPAYLERNGRRWTVALAVFLVLLFLISVWAIVVSAIR